MTDWSQSLGAGRRSGEVVAWLAAGSMVLAAYAAAGVWLTRATAVPPDPGGEEFIVEIALEAAAPPEPEAEPEAQPDIPMVAAPDLPQDDSNDTPEDEPPPEDLTPPEELSELVPDLLPMTEPPPEPMPEPLPVIETAEAVLAPEVSRKPPERPEPRKTTRTPPAPRTTAPAKVEATRVAEVAAAPVPGQAASLEKAVAAWQRDVNIRVNRHMRRWDNKTRAQVVLRLMVSIDGGGKVLSVQVEGTTGDSAADASLRSHAARISGLPRTPDGNSRVLRIPVDLKR